MSTITFNTGSGLSIQQITNVTGVIQLPAAIPNQKFAGKYSFVGWTINKVEETNIMPNPLYAPGSDYAVTTDTALYAVYCYRQDTWVDASNEAVLEDGDYVISWRAKSGTWANKDRFMYEYKHINTSTDEYDATGLASTERLGCGSARIRSILEAISSGNHQIDYNHYLDDITYTIKKSFYGGSTSNTEYLISKKYDGKEYFIDLFGQNHFDIGHYERPAPNDENWDNCQGWTLGMKTARSGNTVKVFFSRRYPKRILVPATYSQTFVCTYGYLEIDYDLKLYRAPFVKYATYPERFADPDRIFITTKVLRAAQGEFNAGNQEISYIDDNYAEDTTNLLNGYGEYVNGSTIRLNISEDANYEVDHWTKNGTTIEDVSGLSYTDNDVAASTEYCIYLKRKWGKLKIVDMTPHEIIGASGYGTISVANSTAIALNENWVSYEEQQNAKYKEYLYYYGSSLGLNATIDNDEWSFAGWKTNPANGYVSIKITTTFGETYKDGTLYGYFINQCTIQCVAHNYNIRTNVGTAFINNNLQTIYGNTGDMFTINAKPGPGFVFYQWTAPGYVFDNSDDQYKPNLKLPIKGKSVRFEAHFQRLMLPIRTSSKYNTFNGTELKSENNYTITINAPNSTNNPITINWKLNIVPLISQKFSETNWYNGIGQDLGKGTD